MKLFDTINVCLFVEDKKEYINVDKIKINISEEGGPCVHNTTIDIECVFDESVFNDVLSSSLLKYEKFMNEYNRTLDPKTGRCYMNKKDLVSNVILYVSKTNSYHGTNDLLKIMELKNVIMTGLNTEENTVMLTCDYYIRFNDYLDIKDKDYLENIFRLININYNKTYNAPYLYMPYLDYTHHHETEDDFNDSETNNEEDDYEWFDYEGDNYQEDEENENTFEKSSKLISKIFSKFYK